MVNKQRKRARVLEVASPRREERWSLDSEKLARRVPKFSAFVEAAEGGRRELTTSQQQFLDEFSRGMAEAMSEGDDKSRAEPGIEAEGKDAGTT